MPTQILGHARVIRAVGLLFVALSFTVDLEVGCLDVRLGRMGDRVVGAERDSGFSRRGLLVRSGAAGLATLLGTQVVFSTGASASGEESPFAGSAEVVELVGGALREALGRGSLPLGDPGLASVVGVELTGPRASLVIDTADGGSMRAGQVETEAGVLLSSVTAHELLIGALTSTFALADRRVTLVGDKRKLACLHHLPYLARGPYLGLMRVAGKGDWLQFSEEEVL